MFLLVTVPFTNSWPSRTAPPPLESTVSKLILFGWIHSRNAIVNRRFIDYLHQTLKQTETRELKAILGGHIEEISEGKDNNDPFLEDAFCYYFREHDLMGRQAICVIEILLFFREIKYPVERSAEGEDKLLESLLEACQRHLCSDVDPGLIYIYVRQSLQVL